ncbi:Hypothetical protein CINCED_3A008519 [Cinara cedri]|uniref:Uncharacterized protein n=1 Tax=Cinara cedri TaxID=506608 RepID=A0A5E4N299_9HEMI|nr:Hypothetical protein CINCED_3A008519 [Cinara cedri]
MDAWFRTGSCRKTKLSSDEGTSNIETASSDIVEMSMLNIAKKTKIYFRNEYFSLQLDESTAVAGQANLLGIVRFELNGNIKEQMLFCQSLSTKTTGEKIFKSVDSFIKENDAD